jgi:hypothetical protein
MLMGGEGKNTETFIPQAGCEFINPVFVCTYPEVHGELELVCTSKNRNRLQVPEYRLLTEKCIVQ